MSTYHFNKISSLALLVSAAGLLDNANAHVFFDIPESPVGSRYTAALQVSHGCIYSPTRQVSVVIPVEVKEVLAEPRDGWTLEVQTDGPAKAAKGTGQTAGQSVMRVTWTAKTPKDFIPSNETGVFVWSAKMPEKPGVLNWPVYQVCEQGHTDWVEIPSPGKSWGELMAPAAVMHVMPTGL